MTKELQNLAWSVIPKEFKEEVKKEYRKGYVCETLTMLITLFGRHNLTSDAEGEEICKTRKTRKMKESEITALAREYAGEVHNFDYFFENENKRFLTWLTRRFCLVEKSKVEEEYHEAKFTCGNVDPCSETFATSLAQKSVLERIFPEIAKDVK